jgi:hypothetical protein
MQVPFTPQFLAIPTDIEHEFLRPGPSSIETGICVPFCTVPADFGLTNDPALSAPPAMPETIDQQDVDLLAEIFDELHGAGACKELHGLTAAAQARAVEARRSVTSQEPATPSAALPSVLGPHAQSLAAGWQRTRHQQMADIERSFRTAAHARDLFTSHPTKPGVTLVGVDPVLPDFTSAEAGLMFSQVIFRSRTMELPPGVAFSADDTAAFPQLANLAAETVRQTTTEALEDASIILRHASHFAGREDRLDKELRAAYDAVCQAAFVDPSGKRTSHACRTGHLAFAVPSSDVDMASGGAPTLVVPPDGHFIVERDAESALTDLVPCIPADSLLDDNEDVLNTVSSGLPVGDRSFIRGLHAVAKNIVRGTSKFSGAPDLPLVLAFSHDSSSSDAVRIVRSGRRLTLRQARTADWLRSATTQAPTLSVDFEMVPVRDVKDYSVSDLDSSLDTLRSRRALVRGRLGLNFIRPDRAIKDLPSPDIESSRN